MQPSLTVFICSTYRDLSSERRAVIEAIKRLRLQYESMEYFGARPNRPIEECLDEVSQSDIIIVIVGHLYGSLVPERNISYTEAEYEEAYRLHKKCLVYFRDKSVPVLPEFFESDSEKMHLFEQFKGSLNTRHTVDTFRGPKDLSDKLTKSLQDLVGKLSAEINTRDQYLALLKKGADVWNKWRYEKYKDDSIKATDKNQQSLDLSNIDLRAVQLAGADLSNFNLSKADLSEADLRNANLRETNLTSARLVGTNLSGALLEKANLSEANLTHTNLYSADLKGANLSFARLIETNMQNARLEDCYVFGVSAWSLTTDGAQQNGLIISPAHEPKVSVDDIEAAQLNYLLLRSDRIRTIINNLQTRSVLILGRFTSERKGVLEVIKSELKQLNFVPSVFDFERPTSRDFTETIMTLAGMSVFIILDITNPKAMPYELSAVLPNYKIPVVPIIQKGERPFAMFIDLRNKYPWVLTTLEYDSAENLAKHFERAVVKPAMAERKRLIGSHENIISPNKAD